MPVECWIKFDPDSEGGDQAKKLKTMYLHNAFIQFFREGGKMKTKIKIFSGILGLLMLVVPMILQAQITTGTLRGFVTDENGDPLPGVTVEISSPSLMTPRSTITDGKGYYRVLFLLPGTYTICTKLEGFETCWLKGISVQVSQTATANIVLKMGGLEVTIEVTAEAPVIDTESASKSYNVNLEMLATIPFAPRMNFSDVWRALPGVAGMWGDSPQVNAGNITRALEPGKSYFWNHHNQDDSYENKIMIDGMEVNDSMSGNSYAQINYEAIQEMDIKTAGASAEYGNARSAFMNIVTKVGGNEFQGSLLFQYQPESFIGTNIEGAESKKISYAIPYLTLSGPIMKDKIWFLASYKYDNQNYTLPDTVIEPKIVEKTRSHMPYAKLTFQLHKNHTASIVYQNDYVEVGPLSFPSSRYSLIETGQTAKRGGPMTSLTWRWIMSDSLYFNFSAGYNRKPRDTYADNQVPRERYTDRFQGGTTRWYAGGDGEDYWSVRENVLFTGHLTYFADDLFNTGSHEIKIGVDIRPYQHITRTRKYHEDALGFYRYRYGLDYADYGLTEPYVYRGYQRRGAPGTPQDRYDNEVTVSNQNFFIQDRWMITKDLTIHLGFRWEHQREFMHFREELPDANLAIYSGMQDNIEFDDSGLAPRLGLTYNAKNVGVFKLHLGRYYEYVGTGDYNNYARTITTDEFRMAAADIGQGPEAMTLYRTGTLGYNADYNDGMKMEYNDEIVLSFEREIMWNMAFETSFIYRKINTSYQEDINAVFSGGAFVDRRFPDYDTIWKRIFYEGSDRRTQYDYKGLQFNVKRNFTGRWGLMANYSFHWRTYKKLEFDPTDPDQFVYSSPSDLNMKNYGIRWSFHLSAFYRFPWDIMFSTYVNGQSGNFISDRTGDYDVNDSAPRITLSNGRRVSDILWQAQNSYYAGGSWGSQGRYADNLWSVNFRLSKAVRIGNVQVVVMMDLYNAFNWAAYTSFQTVDIRHDFYDQKTGPQTPRAAQVSLQIKFN